MARAGRRDEAGASEPVGIPEGLLDLIPDPASDESLLAEDDALSSEQSCRRRRHLPLVSRLVLAFPLIAGSFCFITMLLVDWTFSRLNIVQVFWPFLHRPFLC